MNNTKIVPDQPTLKFLSHLKELRSQKGLTQQELGGLLSYNMEALYDYENFRCYPSLERLIRLCEFYNYDISESLNYRYFHGEIDGFNLLQSLKNYGLGITELAQLTGYSKGTVNRTIHFRYPVSLDCLSLILKILKQEEKHYAYRQKILTASRYEEYKRNRRRKHDA